MKLGLCAFAECGKDEAARGLLDHGWNRIGFADALKRDATEALAAIGVDVDLFGDPVAKKIWRPFLVALGACMRKIQPDHWIRRAIITLANKRLGYQDNVVVTDVRYVNEAEWILRGQGHLVYIERPGVGPANDEERDSIAAILASDLPMVTLVNDGTIKSLHDKLRAIAKSLRSPQTALMIRFRKRYGTSWFTTKRAAADLHESCEKIERVLKAAARDDRAKMREGRGGRIEWSLP